jgi:hypothetical protein
VNVAGTDTGTGAGAQGVLELDAYRMQLWGWMVAQIRQCQQTHQHQQQHPLTDLGEKLRP